MANSGQTGTQAATDTNSFLQQLLGEAAPQLAAGQAGINATQGQLGLVNPELNSELAYNQAMSGYQAQNLGLSEQGLGISQLSNQQQQQQASTQQGFEQQEYNTTQAEAALAYQNAVMQNQGGQAISGTQNTVGGKAETNTLAQNYGYQQQLAGLGQQSEQSGYQFSQQQLQNAAQNLQLNAQANGISQQQLLTMLNYGQQQAGVGAAQNVIGLYGQLGQEEAGQAGTAAQALSQLGFSSGINALAGTGG